MAKEFPPLTKDELIKRMCDVSDEDLTQRQMKDAYEAFCYVVKKAIKSGEGVVLQGVGTLSPIVMEGREMRNFLRGGEKITVPDRLACKFFVNQKFKLDLRECELPKNEE